MEISCTRRDALRCTSDVSSAEVFGRSYRSSASCFRLPVSLIRSYSDIFRTYEYTVNEDSDCKVNVTGNV